MQAARSMTYGRPVCSALDGVLPLHRPSRSEGDSRPPSGSSVSLGHFWYPWVSAVAQMRAPAAGAFHAVLNVDLQFLVGMHLATPVVDGQEPRIMREVRVSTTSHRGDVDISWEST